VLGNNRLPLIQIPIEQVDDLADELVEEYSNPDYRKWYCGIIYEFGVERVKKWRHRASTGNSPGSLFSTYVTQARGTAGPNESVGKSETPKGPERPLNAAEAQARADYEAIKRGLSDAFGEEF
jgi:hypothetical protein